MDHFSRAAEAVAAAGRSIQRNIDRKETKRPKKSGERAMQAGARPYPAPPLPAQHMAKPGKEADLKLAPMCDAPHYKGSEKLKNKVALINGADSGIGRAVAVLFAREGADIAVAYSVNMRTPNKRKLPSRMRAVAALLFPVTLPILNFVRTRSSVP
jgi:hypothetical protein